MHSHSGGLRYSPGRPYYGRHFYGHSGYRHRHYYPYHYYRPYYGPSLGLGYSAYAYPYASDYPYYASTFPLASDEPASTSAAVFYGMGRDWGQDLRREVVPWEKFHMMLRTVVLPAAQPDQQAFRRGFSETYGPNADAAFEKAWREMQNPSGPTNSAEQTP